MISVDDAGLIVGQAQSVVDSPETVAVYSIVIAASAVAGMAGLMWACFRCHRQHLADLRAMIPATEASTRIMNEVARAADHQTEMIRSLLRREG